jgi:hypothetical protein
LAVAAGGALLLLAAGLVWALWGSAGGDEPEEPETVRAYTAKYTRAQEMADDGQWADALVAWGEARALAGKLRRKPATYRTLIERIDEAKERLRTTSAPTAAGEAGEGKTAADVGTTPPAAAAPGPKAEAPKAAAAAAAAPKPGHAPAGKAAAATRPTAEPPATRPAAKAEDAEERVRGALQKAGKFRFVGTPLKAVLDEISAAAGVKITCPTETRRILDQPVSTVLVDVTMETALEKVLYPRGLDFEATAEGVVVAPATPESLARKMEDRANRRATQSRQAR